MKTVTFQGEQLELKVTDHAQARMDERAITEAILVETIETGEVKAKGKAGKFWVWKQFPGREDNLVAFSVAVENPRLIVITAMVNWRPQ